MKRACAFSVAVAVLLSACGGGEPVTEVGLDPVTPPVSGSPSNPSTPSTPSTPVVGSATLSWIPPTENEDGTALTNLAGYVIVYGTSPTALDRQINLSNPGLTRYVVDNLSGGTWYFAIRAYSSTGAQSALSGIASKTIS